MHSCGKTPHTEPAYGQIRCRDCRFLPFLRYATYGGIQTHPPVHTGSCRLFQPRSLYRRLIYRPLGKTYPRCKIPRLEFLRQIPCFRCRKRSFPRISPPRRHIPPRKKCEDIYHTNLRHIQPTPPKPLHFGYYHLRHNRSATIRKQSTILPWLSL